MHPASAAALVICIFQGAHALATKQYGMIHLWTAAAAVNTYFGLWGSH